MTLFFSLIFGLVSMFAYGFNNALSKPLSQKYGPSQMLFLRGVTVSVVLAVVAIPSYHYFHNGLAVLATILLGVAGYIPVLAFSHGIKNSRLGIVAPVAGTAPLVTVLLAFFFLAVPIALIQWLAIGLVVFANVAVSFDPKNWRQSDMFQLSSGIPFALVAALGWGLFYFFLVPATHALGPWLSAFLVEVGVTLAAGFHIWSASNDLAAKDLLNPSVVGNGILICVGTLAFTFGIEHYNVGIVATFSNSTALVATVARSFLFKERLRNKEKIAIAALIIGIATLSLG